MEEKSMRRQRFPKIKILLPKRLKVAQDLLGDIDATPEEIQILESGNIEAILELRSVMMDKRWPRESDGMVRIPYYISGKYNDKEEAHIARAFEDFENNTCIRYDIHLKHFRSNWMIKMLSIYIVTTKTSYLRFLSAI